MFFAGWLVEKAAFIQENAAVFCDEVELLGAPDPPSQWRTRPGTTIVPTSSHHSFSQLGDPTQIAAESNFFFFLVA